MMKEQKMIIYQVLPRLFGNTRSNNTPKGSLEENGCGKLSAFTGKALEEIKAMGFSHIWYTGLLEHATQTDYSAFGIRRDHPAIVKGKAGSPYAIKDYYDIDPDLADKPDKRMKEFENLLARTHKAGLKAIMDFIPNHVARQYYSDAKPEGVIDLGEQDDQHTTFNHDNNFYYIPGQSFSPDFSLCAEGEADYSENPAKATGNDCFNACPSRNDWYETVKLNYGIDYLGGGHHYFDPIPNTWLRMRDILLFWASKKIDGFRCDMAEMVPVAFWEWAIPSVKAEYPEVIFIAEVYNPDQYRNYIHNGKFDYLYDKVGLYDTLRAVTCGWQSAKAITHCWQAVNDIQAQMLNFLENHDEQRIASEFFAGDPERAIPAMIVSATMNTNPLMIYAGQELGEPGMDAEGFSGRDGRTTIFDYWSVESLRNWYNRGKLDDAKLSEKQKGVRAFYIQLLNLCKTEKAITEGLFYDLMYVNEHNYRFDADRHYVYMRKYKNELLLIVVNFGDNPSESQIFLPAHAFDYLELAEGKIGQGKDLLSGEEMEGAMKRDDYFPVRIAGRSGRIIQFRMKNKLL